MRRKIKFPLIMQDGIEVRNIEELRESFDLEKIIGYYLDGKLQKWLKDRDYEKELIQILEIDKEAIKIKQDICEVFKINYKEHEVDIEKVIKINDKYNKLNQYTDEPEWIDKVESIVFDQDELDHKLKIVELYNREPLLGENKAGIFEINYKKLFKNSRYQMHLCGDKFDINDRCENVEYIGVNNPELNIYCNGLFDAYNKNIEFQNVRLLSNSKFRLKVKEVEGYSIDESSIKIESKINVKYNKTIIKSCSTGNRVVVDEDGKVHVLGTIANGLGWIPEFEGKVVSIGSNSVNLMVALDENGKVYQWGSLPYKFESIPENLPKIKQISVSSDTVIALDYNGNIHHWGGWNYNSKFINKEEVNYDGKMQKPLQNIKSKIVQVEYDGCKGVLVDKNGRVYTWGYANREFHNIPKDLPFIKKVILENHEDSAVAIDESGKLHFWGSSRYGLEKIPKDLPAIVDVSIDGIEFSALDENGMIYIWGDYAEEWPRHYDDVKNLPKLVSIFGYGGVDENGIAHGCIRSEKLDNIKIMNPIR